MALTVVTLSPPAGRSAAAKVTLSTPDSQSSRQTSEDGVGLWQDVDEKNLKSSTRRAAGHGPRAYRTLKLNRGALATILAAAPLEFSQDARASRTVLSLPLADGTYQTFRIVESPIMEPALAVQYPGIKTYAGQGVEDPTATTRFDWTPTGFHAIVLSRHGTLLIEPYGKGDTETYIAYFQHDFPVDAFGCGVTEDEQEVSLVRNNEVVYDEKTAASSGTTLRRYRLAVAATGEYTQTYGDGTVGGGLAAITTTVNQVNAIYEREVSIRLVLIANEALIIFTDPASDGYSSDNVSALINENQTRLDSIIGAANYDIGHVFDGRLSDVGWSFQGQVGSIGSACDNDSKARAATITRSVEPSAIVAYYITAHEIGHQFSATHTFNATTGDCGSQRAGSTAYEPGTGSTIMGYRFNCGAEDMMSSDTYFHNASIEQILNYTTAGRGNSCPALTATGNNPPIVSAGTNYTIPKNTPFTLTAVGSDPDADALLFGWEEFDLGTPAPPDTDDGSRPIFRSMAPVASPSRTFPRLSDILNGSPSFGESLPVTTRTMNFRVTARDTRSGGGGVNSASMQLSVTAASGPFTVSQPGSGTNWPNNSSQTLTWNVANTSVSPVSCARVQILLSIDDGNSFPIVLANDTPNDGAETVTIPGVTTARGRVKVAAVGNIFFNISPRFGISGVNNSAPTISGFTPSSGVVGSSVTISGTNFITPSAVNFNGTQAEYTVSSTTRIVAVVPFSATTGPISVKTPSGTAFSTGNFTVDPTPPQSTAPDVAARAALDSLGRMYLFYRHLGDAEVRYVRQSSAGSDSWSQPSSDIGGMATSTNPIAVADAQRRLWVFVGGTGNGVHVSHQISAGGAGWSGRYVLSGSNCNSNLAAVRNIDDRLQVFCRGADNALWHIRQTSPGSDQWDAPVSLGGALASEPVAGINANGQVEIFVKGADGALYATRQAAPGSTAWLPFYRIGGSLTSSPAVARDGAGALAVCYRGNEKGLGQGIACFVQKTNTTDWGKEVFLGGVSAGGPAVATNSDGTLQVFIRSQNDNSVLTVWQASPGGSFTQSWQSLGGTLSGAPLTSPVLDGLARLHLFVRGQSFDLQYNRQSSASSSGGWRGFKPLGDSAQSF